MPVETLPVPTVTTWGTLGRFQAAKADLLFLDLDEADFLDVSPTAFFIFPSVLMAPPKRKLGL